MVQTGTKSTESDTKTIKRDTKSDVSGTESKKSNRLSDWELADLMGTNRPTYARKRGGAFTQR